MAMYESLSCELILTSRCNLACTYCIARDLTSSTLSSELGKKAIDLFLTLGKGAKDIEFTFTGGEPLVVFHLLELLTRYIDETCKQKNVKPSFVLKTNGTILNNAILHYIQFYNVRVVVSLDGTNRSHDKYRKNSLGENTHATVSRNISTLLQKKVPCLASITVHPTECNSVLENVRQLYVMGLRKIDVGPAYGTVKWSNSDCLALAQCLFDIAEYMKKVRESGDELDVGPLHQMTEHVNGQLEHQWGCHAGSTNLAFMPKGEIVGCSALAMLVHKMPDLVIGNVLSGIHREAFERFGELAHAGAENRITCINCGASPNCTGGCMAINLSESGKALTPPPFYCQTLTSIPSAWEIAWR